MRILPLIHTGMVCLWLGGCALAGMGASEPPATFNLSAPDLSDAKFRRWPVQITVSQPTAMRALDTDRVLVMASGGRIAYFENAAWSDRLTSLVRARIVEAMQDSRAFRAVLTTEDRVDGEYTLAVEIRKFEVEVAEGRSEAVVTLFVKLVDNLGASVIATRQFNARSPASSDDPANGIVALQSDFDQVTKELVKWLSSRRWRDSA